MTLSVKTQLRVISELFANYETLYIALFNALPSDTSWQSRELAYDGYQRYAVTVASGFAPMNGAYANTQLIEFPYCSGVGDIATHYAVVDTESGAFEVMVLGAFAVPTAVIHGNPPQFDVGEIVVKP